MPWAFSILAMILMLLPSSPSTLRISWTPLLSRMNDAKIISTCQHTNLNYIAIQKHRYAWWDGILKLRFTFFFNLFCFKSCSQPTTQSYLIVLMFHCHIIELTSKECSTYPNTDTKLKVFDILFRHCGQINRCSGKINILLATNRTSIFHLTLECIITYKHPTTTSVIHKGTSIIL